jgi:histidine triad (HIT) family protein
VISKKIGQALVDSLGVTGFNLSVNNGAVAGQLVPHLHFHLVPRLPGDGFKLWQGTPYGSDGEREVVADKIRSALS